MSLALGWPWLGPPSGPACTRARPEYAGKRIRQPRMLPHLSLLAMRVAPPLTYYIPQPTSLRKSPPPSQVSYKFLAFLLRSSFLRFFSLCLFIFDRRFFNVLENRAKTPPNTPPNHDEDDDEGRRRVLLLVVVVGGANAVHVVAVGLLLDVRQEAEEGKSVADEVKARWLLVKGKGREMTVEEATRLHSVWRAAAMSLWRSW